MNFYLENKNTKILNLKQDQKDGTKLFLLIESITGKPIQNWNSTPKFKFNFFQNLQTFLNFIKKEGLPELYISVVDIENGNLKSIFLLISSIIKFYHFEKKKVPFTPRIKIDERKMLLNWLKEILEDNTINFSDRFVNLLLFIHFFQLERWNFIE